MSTIHCSIKNDRIIIMVVIINMVYKCSSCYWEGIGNLVQRKLGESGEWEGEGNSFSYPDPTHFSFKRKSYGYDRAGVFWKNGRRGEEGRKWRRRNSIIFSFIFFVSLFFYFSFSTATMHKYFCTIFRNILLICLSS